MSKISRYLLIATLALSGQGWCGCLGLGDDEIESKHFIRVFNNLKDFMQTNAASIKTLKTEGFFSAENSSRFSANVTQALSNIKENRESIIVKDYKYFRHWKNIRELQTDLFAIRESLPLSQRGSDLTPKQSQKFSDYVNRLDLILKAFNL